MHALLLGSAQRADLSLHLTKATLNPWGSHLLVKGLEKAHKDNRILLSSKDLYKSGCVPDGEEDYLFQYIFTQVNDDCETGVIKFDNCYTKEGAPGFFNYVCNEAHTRMNAPLIMRRRRTTQSRQS